MVQPLRPLALVLSGFTGAVLVACWMGRLDGLPGALSGGLAGALVLSMAAAGAWRAAPRAERARLPARSCGALGIGVGVWALALPAALRAVSGWWYAEAPGLSPGAAEAVSLGVLLAALGTPAVAMGRALPLMVRAVAGGAAPMARPVPSVLAHVGLGATAGGLLSGLALVPLMGGPAAERMAGAVLVLTAAATALLGARPGEPRGQAVARPAQRTRAASLAAALVGGAAAVDARVASRVLSPLFTGVGSASSLVVSACLAGLTVGCLWGATRPFAPRALARMQWLTVGAVCLAMSCAAACPPAWAALEAGLARTPGAWLLSQLVAAAACCVALALPMGLLGASLASVATLTEDTGPLGMAAVSAAGGGGLGLAAAEVLARAGGGLEGAGLLGVACTVAGALWLGRSAPISPGRRARVTATVGVVCVVAWAILSRGWSQPVVSPDGRDPHTVVRFAKTDEVASVVVDQPPGGELTLWIDGVGRGVSGAQLDPQLLAPHLALLSHPFEVKRVLLLGLGTGITAASLLTHPIEQLDVVEPSAAVVEAASANVPEARSALSDPRCHLLVGEPRDVLARAAARYDVIIASPSRPWGPGAARLFTREALQLARSRLAPGGRLLHWVELARSSTAMAKVAVRTLRAAFPRSTAWGGPTLLLLVGSQEAQEIDVEVVRARLSRPAVAADLARLRLREATTLLGRQVHDDEAQRAFGGEGPVNTDAHNLLELGAPLAAFVGRGAEVDDARLDPARQKTLAWARWRRQHPASAVEAADLHAHLAQVYPPGEPLVRASAEAWLALGPGTADAATAVARASRLQGNAGRAIGVSQPLIDAGARDAGLITEWLLAVSMRARRAVAPWHAVDVAPALAIGREALAAHPDDEAIADALRELEALR